MKTLDQLRADYERAVSQDAQNGNKGESKLTALEAEVKELRAAEADRNYRKEMSEFIVPTIAGELGVDADIVEMWANKQASEDAQLMALWSDRGEKRKEFKAAIEALKPSFEKYAKDKGLVKEDKKPASKGVQSAVRSARETTVTGTKEMPTTGLGAMSDQQFAMHSQEVFRLARAGQLH